LVTVQIWVSPMRARTAPWPDEEDGPRRPNNAGAFAGVHVISRFTAVAPAEESGSIERLTGGRGAAEYCDRSTAEMVIKSSNGIRPSKLPKPRFTITERSAIVFPGATGGVTMTSARSPGASTSASCVTAYS
jgi:hypothetical protein